MSETCWDRVHSEPCKSVQLLVWSARLEPGRFAFALEPGALLSPMRLYAFAPMPPGPGTLELNMVGRRESFAAHDVWEKTTDNLERILPERWEREGLLFTGRIYAQPFPRVLDLLDHGVDLSTWPEMRAGHTLGITLQAPEIEHVALLALRFEVPQ